MSDTYPQAALGFRLWYAGDDGGLRSCGLGQLIWERGVNLAECRRTPYRSHAAPDDDCMCGLYACHTLAQALAQDTGRNNIVVGVVAARGKLCVHHHGFRAEESCVIAIAPLPGDQISDTIRLASLRYGIPVVKADQLPALGRRHAESIPDSIKPAMHLGKAPWSRKQGDLDLSCTRDLWIEEAKLMARLWAVLAIVMIPLMTAFAGRQLSWVAHGSGIVLFVGTLLLAAWMYANTRDWVGRRRTARERIRKLDGDP